MDVILVASATYISVASMAGIIATVFFVFNPFYFNTSQLISTRYFTLVFLSFSLFFLFNLARPLIPAYLSILLSNLFLLIAIHSLRYGLMWRTQTTHNHLYQDGLFFVHLVVALYFNVYLFYYVENLQLEREVVVGINIIAVYILCFGILQKDKSKPTSGEKVLKIVMAILIPLPALVIIPHYYLRDIFLNMSMVLTWMTMQTFALFGGLMFLQLSDVIDLHYKNSVTDPMTHLFNRRYFMDRAHAMLNFAQRHSYPMALLMCDLDHFKMVNDQYGHNIGDIVLKEFSKNLKQASRVEDTVARYGGEEFIILMPQTTIEGASHVAMRIQEEVKNLAVNASQGVVTITVSIGVSKFDSKLTIVENLKQVDEALYLAKKSGRDRIIVSDS